MPKNDQTSSRSSRKAAAKQKPLTPEEAKHQAAIAAIKGIVTLPAAFVEWKDLRERIEGLHSKKVALDSEHRKVDGLRTKAAAAQDYVSAQEHKSRQEAILQESTAIEAEMKPLRELCEAARVHHTELFLADEKAPYNQPDSVTLYRIQVINPVTKNFESVHYLDCSETVSLHLDGKSFSSEAYHLGSWAEEQGYVTRREERPIVF